MGNYIKS